MLERIGTLEPLSFNARSSPTYFHGASRGHRDFARGAAKPKISHPPMCSLSARLPRTIYLFILLSLTASFPTLAIETGKLAPDFTLRSNLEKNLRLNEYRGQVVLVNFWGSWCGPCASELPLLQVLYDTYHAQGLQVFGINLDSDASAAHNTVQRLKITFPILFDDLKHTSALYEPADIPATYLIGRDGVVRYQFKSYETGQEQRYEQHIRTLLAE